MTEATIQSDSSDMPVFPSLARQILNVLLYTIRLLSGSYGMSVTGLILLRLILGADNWDVIALFNALLHMLILPALILFPIFLMWRKWVVVILLIAPVFMFSTIYAPRFFNTAPTLPDDVQTFTILSHNLRSESQDTTIIIDAILDADADFVALQEVSLVMAEQIEADLQDEYPYQSLHPLDNPIVGQAFLSRYPILESDSWREVNHHQRYLVEVDNSQFVIYNVHMAFPLFDRFDSRRADVDSVLMRTSAETHPVIIVGDFNLTDLSAEYMDITNRYTDSFLEAGHGFGFTFAPAKFFTSRETILQYLPLIPLLRIDYVFHDDNFTAFTADVLSDDGVSDHRRYRVTLGITQ